MTRTRRNIAAYLKRCLVLANGGFSTTMLNVAADAKRLAQNRRLRSWWRSAEVKRGPASRCQRTCGQSRSLLPNLPSEPHLLESQQAQPRS